MRNIVPNTKQKLLAKKYLRYLGERHVPTDKLHNKHNIFDDLNSRDNAMMKEARRFLIRANGDGKSITKSEKTEQENIMPKDRGRKAVKKPKQVKVNPGA